MMKWFYGITVAVMCFCFGVYYGQTSTELIFVQVEYVPYPVEDIKEVRTVITQKHIVEVAVPIHNEPGLHEFESKSDLRDYVRWYRNEKMVQYGKDQCEDYAYDFMQQAIADGYLVSTELIEKSAEVWHMANTVPSGNNVWLVEISAGSIELYALKD